jgi:hypothetical protein
MPTADIIAAIQQIPPPNEPLVVPDTPLLHPYAPDQTCEDPVPYLACNGTEEKLTGTRLGIFA